MFDKLMERLGVVTMKQKVPLTPQEVRDVGKNFEFVRIWHCSKCPAQMKIRAKENRANGPSNFAPFPIGHKIAGHSMVASGDLTWNGLAEERGWRTDPVVCPACQHGLIINEYKSARREGKL